MYEVKDKIVSCSDFSPPHKLRTSGRTKHTGIDPTSSSRHLVRPARLMIILPCLSAFCLQPDYFHRS